MPDEPQDINKKPSDMPHFNEFSGHGNDESTQFESMVDNTPPVEPKIISPAVVPTIQPSAGFTPFPPEPVDKPTESQQPPHVFAPAPVVASGPSPSNMRISDTTISQQPIQASKSSGLSGFLKNKKLVIGIVIAFLIVLIGGGSTFAFVSYYQNPEKVIADSIINAVTAKSAVYTGNFTYDLKSDYSNVKATVEFTAKQANSATGSLNAKLTLTIDGKKTVVAGDALVDSKGDLYFKVDGVAKIVDEAMTTYGTDFDAKTNSTIDKLVQKIDNTWVKVSTDDIATFSEDYSTAKQCVNDAFDKFKDDKAAIAEVTDLYTKNPFIVVKKELPQKDGSFGYEIEYAEKAGTEFGNGLNDTKIYKELNNCDSDAFTMTDSTSSESSSSNSSVYDTENSTTNVITYKLWVNIWSHQITNFEVVASSSNNYSTDKQTGSFYIKPDYSKKVTIDTPSKSITLSELKTYIEDLGNSLSNSDDTTYYM